MNRFFTTTAIGLLLGLAPAIAQTLPPGDEARTPPAAAEPSQQIPEVMPDSAHPAEPAAPIPGNASQLSPAPSDHAAPPMKSSEMPLDSAGPKSAAANATFVTKQESDDWLATKLIGQTVYNANDEVVGDINDLVTDRGGKIVAVLVGSGGFLGIGEKNVGLRFDDLKLARDENDHIKIVVNLNKETLAAAPDYLTLSAQKVTVGSSKNDREDIGAGKVN